MPPGRHRFPEIMIRVDHVTFAYPGSPAHPVLDDVSCIIQDGEEIAVIGGNGSGKTTLGLLLSGILKPDHGRIMIDGKPPGSERDSPVIGFLFQDPDNGLVATTVEREVAFSLENQNCPSDEMMGIVNRTLERFDLSRFRSRLVWNLSGGEKQRLSLAGLFASGPRILFLDEPASFLDLPGIRQLDEALGQFRQTNTGLIIIRVTQYPRVADQYRRILVMGGGKILKDAPPEQVFTDRNLLTSTGLRPPFKYLPVRSSPRSEQSNVGESIPMQSPLLKLQDVAFGFDGAASPPIFEKLSLDIYPGEVVGLMGPTGCGKSTLAQIICGIYQPTQGSVYSNWIGFRAVMSFQQPERQFFLDTAYDEVAYGIKDVVGSNNSVEEIVRRSMTAAGLDFELFRHRAPHTLSGGEARRLAFAIVIALRADLIIFDEPTCGLDEAGVVAFKKMVETLKGDGKTVMLISHDSDIIADKADRVVFLHQGRPDFIGSPLQFFASDIYHETLSIPEIVDYQQGTYGKVLTTHPADVFDMGGFFA